MKFLFSEESKLNPLFSFMLGFVVGLVIVNIFEIFISF